MEGNLGEGFTPSSLPDKEERPILPQNTYEVVCTKCELKQTAKKNGLGLAYFLQVAEGEYKGSSFFYWVNWVNENKTCENIGRAELKDICKAFGLEEHVTDTSQFVGKSCRVFVVVGDVKGKPGNIIEEFIGDEPVNGSTPVEAAHSDDNPPF